MSFLTSVFLWLIPLISIPLLIHLFNRRQLNTIEFSSIQFLQKIKKESIKRLNILHIILLIIRTLIILLIILMTTRPFINGRIVNWIDGSASTFTAIIIDDSFSMQGSNNEVKLQKAFNEIVNLIPDGSTVQIINGNEGEVFHGIFNKSNKINFNIKLTYGTVEINNLLDIINLKSKKYANKEVFILTDRQGLKQITNLGIDYIKEAWNYYIYHLLPLSNNLSVSNIEINNEIILPDVPITLKATITNNGLLDIDNRFIQLIIDDISVGQQSINLIAGESTTILFTTAIPNNGSHLALLELQADDRNKDNTFHFLINTNSKMNISLISNNISDLTYIIKSIDALNKKSNIYSYKTYTEKTLNTWNPNTTNLLFVLGNQVSHNNKIISFVNNGGTAIYLPASTDTEFTPLNIQNNQKSGESLITFTDSYQELKTETIQNQQLLDIFSLKNNYANRNIKIFKYFKTNINSNVELLKLEDSSILLGKSKISSGNLFYFTSSIHLNWNNLAIKGSFIPLIHYLLHTGSNLQSNSFDYQVGESIEIEMNPNINSSSTYLRVENPYGEYEKHSRNSSTLNILNTNIPGFYSIRNDNNQILNQIAINISDIETENYNLVNLETEIDRRIILVDDVDKLSLLINSARVGKELWRNILYLIIVLVITEMLLSNVHRKRLH